MRLTGRVAIVTGGARHIGAAYCRRLAEEGASVVIADILDGAAVAAEIKGKGGKAMSLRIDVSKEEDTNRMASEAVQAFGRIDILFNNAGVFYPRTALDCSEEEWDLQIDVNLKGTFLMSKFALPGMIEQGSGAWSRIHGWLLKCCHCQHMNTPQC